MREELAAAQAGAFNFGPGQTVAPVTYGAPGRLPIKFERVAREVKKKTEEAGICVYEDVDVATIFMPGGDKRGPLPWTSFSKAEQAEYGPHYEAWKRGQTMAETGTPLEMVPWLSPARVAELKARHIATLETLATLSEPDIGSKGRAGRNEVEKAKAYLAAGKDTAAVTKLASENTRLQEETAALREELEELKQALLSTKQDKKKKEIKGDE